MVVIVFLTIPTILTFVNTITIKLDHFLPKSKIVGKITAPIAFLDSMKTADYNRNEQVWRRFDRF